MAILDVGLPDMRAKQVYDALVASRPDLNVLLCSGYSIEGEAREILRAGADDFLQKPFSYGELSKKMGELEKQYYGLNKSNQA